MSFATWFRYVFGDKACGSDSCCQSDEAPQENPKIRTTLSATNKDDVEKFIEELSAGKGKKLQVLCRDGSREQCWLSLSQGLSVLFLAVDGDRHCIALAEVRDVCCGKMSPEHVEFREIVPDDLCCTLLLHGHQTVTFAFENPRSRDMFADRFRQLRSIA